MSLAVSFLPGLLSGAAIGMAYYSSTVIRRQWLLSRRREFALAKLAAELSDLLGEETPPPYEVVMMAWQRGCLKVYDELHNQSLWRERHHWPWSRVPDPGTEWPDFEPAPLLGEQA